MFSLNMKKTKIFKGSKRRFYSFVEGGVKCLKDKNYVFLK